MARWRDARTGARWPRTAALLIALAASACAHAGASRSAAEAEAAAVRAAIDAGNAEFASALVRGDAKAMAAVFAEDGELIPARDRGVVTGRAEIEAHQSRLLQARRYLDVALTTSQLGHSGDLAWESGTSRMTVQQGETAPMTVTGRYLAVWKREPDGRWRIRADLAVADPIQ